MSFLAPALLFGLLGLGIPIAAHLLGRDPPRTIEFAAVRFLTAEEPTVARRRALHEPLLLLVRLLLLALAVLVLARPASFDRTGMAMVAEPHDAVLLLDGSAGATLRVGKSTLLEHAATRADALLDSLPPGSRVGLVTSDPNGPVVDPTADPDRVRTAIAEWIDGGAPRLGAWPLRDALPRATALLRGLDGVDADRKRVVYAIADGTPSGLGGLPPTGEGGVTIVPIPALDPDETVPQHVGITAVTWEPAPDLDPRAVRLHATVKRHADGEPAADADDDIVEVPVAVAIDGVEVARGRVALAPGAQAPVEFTHTMLGEAQSAAATVRLDLPADPLAIDDERHLWLTADEAVEVVVVNGDPSELRAHDEVFFLATALAVNDRDQRLRLTSLAPDQLESRIRERGAKSLSDVDVLVLANVRAPAEDVAPAIVERVNAGMGLWVTVGDRVETEAYNDRLGDLLPLRLREVVHVGTAPGRTEARAESFAPADMAHPMFRGLGGELALASAKVRKIALVDPDPARGAQAALAYTNGAPALLTRTQGNGRVALLTTSIDRDWADLPLRPGFVPLVAAALAWLGDAQGTAAAAQVAVGEPKTLRGRDSLVVEMPGGRELTLPIDESGHAVLHETFVPGHYRVRDGSETSTFVVAVDPSESETRWTVHPDAEAEGPEGRVAVAIPRWREIVLVVMLLLGIESTLRLVRRRRS
ncbi:MAG TPA: BatA domain-containing protein [Nannocystaceae bacterium]|nr:BatA domain-containing protein [Nannocystaceae bacterium]